MSTSVFLVTEAKRASLTIERDGGALNDSHIDFIKHLETLSKAYAYALSEYEATFSMCCETSKGQLALILKARAHIENAIEALQRVP